MRTLQYADELIETLFTIVGLAISITINVAAEYRVPIDSPEIQRAQRSVAKVFVRWIIGTVLVGCVQPVFGQDVPDSKGRDFWFALMPNFHNQYDVLDENPALRLQHEVFIYIGAEQPTRGRIILKDAAGAVRVEPFQITDPTQMYEFHTYVKPYELVGWNRSGQIDFSTMQTEEIAENTIHVTADSDVTVYALNQGVLTSEAFLVLPTDALAEDYVVASYTSDIDGGLSVGLPLEGTSTPSQFCIVATEDNTTVTFRPTAATMKSEAGEAQTITLNQGQVYLVQIHPDIDRFADLTGTQVRASKPVAVFGGHQRAVLPIEDQSFLGSRDCLIEQMNPIRTWGKTAFIFPLALSSNELPGSDSRFRVIAAFDSTEVFVDGMPVANLNAGSFYEGLLVQAAEVRTTKPSMVAMLKKSGGAPGVGGARLGDPFMMLVPPAEQFMDSYRFVSIQAHEYSLSISGTVVQGERIYVEQFLNVVIPTASVSSLQLDGAPFPAVSAFPIGGTDYSYLQVNMTDGIHHITADTTFGIYVYGYGEANSYGYIGGMAFRPLDVLPPEISGSAACGVFRGVVSDSVLGDSRIRSARVLPGSEVNATVTLDTFSPPVSVVGFTATLNNPYMDGQFAVEATDNVRQVSSETYTIPGYTIGAVGRGSDLEPATISVVVPINRLRCDTVLIENYGQTAHAITALSTALGATITEPMLPRVVQPGETVAVVICSQIESIGVAEDTLYIGDTCVRRAAYRLLVDVRADTEPPYTVLSAAPCDSNHVLVVGDDRDLDYGILFTSVIDASLVNCTVEPVSQSVQVHRYTVVVQDPLHDAIYGIMAEDSAGNRREIYDTIPGFTLAIVDEQGWFSSVPLGSTPLGEVMCDSVWLSNYGYFDQTVSSVFVYRNLLFSVPAHQLPITIPPGGRVPLMVCYEPLVVNGQTDLDTLAFSNGCLAKLLEVASNAQAVTFQGLSRCDVPVFANTTSITNRLLTMPLPATDVLYIRTKTPTTALTLDVVDVQGALISRRTWRGGASSDFQLDVRHMAQGTYLLIAVHDGGTETSSVVVR